jgi:nucleoside-diphosphate-sugar epimerase
MSLIIPNIVSRPAFIPEFDAWGSFSGKQVAITGASGTLGKILCGKLEARGICYHKFPGDITIAPEVSDWIRKVKPDVFFHLAAIVSTEEVLADPSKAMKTNALSMLPIMDCLKDVARNCWFFYASTSHVYGDTVNTGHSGSLSEDSPISPISLYGATKLAGESICQPMAETYGIDLCIGRIFSFYHESQPDSYLIPSLYKRILAASGGSDLELQNPDAIRDFLNAEMVVDAILWLSTVHAEGIVNIASGTGISVGEIANKISQNEDKNINFLGFNNIAHSSLVANISRLSKLIKAAHE